MFNFDLSQEIENYLIAHSPCREYDIIVYLQSIGLLPNNALQHPLSMFRSHFLVYNCLYRLKIKGQLLQAFTLEISSLNIALTKILIPQSSCNSICNHDPLACFYLDMQHLHQMDETDVSRLLNDFWKNYFTPKQHIQALDILGLQPPVDIKVIKKQYRRLVMRHHPDRGGDPQKLVALNQAMSCLKHYYPEPSF